MSATEVPSEETTMTTTRPLTATTPTTQLIVNSLNYKTHDPLTPLKLALSHYRPDELGQLRAKSLTASTRVLAITLSVCNRDSPEIASKLVRRRRGSS